MSLWHFTCDHGYAGLGIAGWLRPYEHVLAPELGPVIWLTDDSEPSRDDVGLTSMLLSCDRMTYRYRVASTSRCIPWSSVRSRVSAQFVKDAESFGAPETWWLSREPLRAVLAQPVAEEAGTLKEEAGRSGP